MTRSIHFTASACALAQAIYYSCAQAFGVAIQPWEDIPVETRHEYVQRAGDLLEEFRPAPRRSFDYLGLAIGAIRPDQPFGEGR